MFNRSLRHNLRKKNIKRVNFKVMQLNWNSLLLFLNGFASLFVKLRKKNPSREITMTNV